MQERRILSCKKEYSWVIDRDPSGEGKMNARPKKKLCWNCEGSVSSTIETCPYCGVSVVGISADLSPAPPYRFVNAKQEPAIPVSPFSDFPQAQPKEPREAVLEEEEETLAEEEGNSPNETKLTIIVLAALFLGSVFFVFGFALFLFSEEGRLSLEWNASYWYAYLLLSLPLLFFGFQKLNQIKDPE